MRDTGFLQMRSRGALGLKEGELQFNQFKLTDAVSSTCPKTLLAEGFSVLREKSANFDSPHSIVTASVSSEKIMNVFQALLNRGCQIYENQNDLSLVLKTIYGIDNHISDEKQIRTNKHNLPFLLDILNNYEDLFLNDGFTGVSIIIPERPLLISLDTHKLIHVISDYTDWAVEILESNQVKSNQTLSLISATEHTHHTSDTHVENFERLCYEVGAP